MDPQPPQPLSTQSVPPRSSFVSRLLGKWRSASPRSKLTASLVIFALSLVALGVSLKISPWRLKDLLPNQPAPASLIPEGFSQMEIPQREPSFFTLTPDTSSIFGISPRQVFSLVTRGPVTTEFVQSRLKSSVPFRVTAQSDTRFQLTPVSPVGLNQVVSVSLAVKDESDSGHTFDRNYGWSYQTQGKFRVTSALPGHQKKDVPRNTGIEFTFSQDDYQDPAPLVSISPAVQYRSERHGQTYSLIPLQPLAPQTIYTVTLKSGLDLSSRTDPITQDYSFSFQTAAIQPVTPKHHVYLQEDSLQVTPQEQAAIKVYASSNWPSDREVKVKAFKFASPSDYVLSRAAKDASSRHWYSEPVKPVDTSRLGEVLTAQLKVQEKENVKYLQLPAALSSGQYLVQIWNDDQSFEQVWLQSTNVSGYVSAGRMQTLVWANSVQDASALGAARVTVMGGGGEFYTSDNGVAVFGTPQLLYAKSTHYIQVTSAAGEVVLLRVASLSDRPSQTEIAIDYWSYLYHERTLYKPTDTVYLWGVAKNRNSNQPPSSIKISLSRGYSDNTQVIQSKDVSVSADGTFYGSLAYSDLPAGWYSVQAQVGSIVLSSSGFNITSYEKPEMKIDVIADRHAMFVGEKAAITARASFFDGTPAKNLQLRVHTEYGGQQDLTTNDAGEITYTYIPSYDRRDSYPRYESVTISPLLAERAKVEGHSSVFVFGSRLMLTSADSQTGQKATAKTVLNWVDLSGLNNSTSQQYQGNPAENTSVKMVITKHWTDREQTGTYYDFVEKTTRTSYLYRDRSEKISEQVLTTNSQGVVEHNFDMEKNRSYTVEFTATDQDSHIVFDNQNFYYYDGPAYSPPTSDTTPQLKLDRTDNSYSVGENVNLNIQQNGQPYQGGAKSRYLFISAQRGRQDYFVEGQPRVSIPFQSKHIPNFTVGALIFTGDRYVPVTAGCSWDWYCYYDYSGYYFSGLTVNYRQDDSKLDLRLAADKTKYRPGETANVAVTVTHKGQIQSNTEVNLVLVDEAMAAIGGVIRPSPLNSLYEAIPDQIYYSYYTHRPLLPDIPQAEKGGGGGDYREVFKDTSFFGRAVTDDKGVARFSFTLPDNLTTWIVYGQSATADLKAGQAETTLAVTKDFFVTSQFPRQYLTVDRPMLTAAGFGNALKQGDTVNFRAAFYQGDTEKSVQQKSAEAMKEISFDFPELSPGEYRAGLKGTFGSLEDGVLYPFSVINSRVSLEVAKNYRLNKDDEIKKIDLGQFQAEKSVTLLISDAGRGQYFYQLLNFCFTGSNRLEKQIASQRASQVLNTRFNHSRCRPTQTNRSQFQGQDGGLSQVWWGGSQLETTVWAIYVDPAGYDPAKLVEYLDKASIRADSGSLQQLYASWGLTLLGQPRITQLMALADSAAGFEEKAVAALALASTGNTERARELYYDILADYGYTNQPYIRIQRNGLRDQDKFLKDTSYALLLGSLVLKDYNAGMYAYLRDYRYRAEDVVLDLGTIAFIDEEMSRLPQEDTQVSVNTPLTQKTIDLSHGGSSALSLQASELGSLNLKVVKGKAEVAVHYHVGLGGIQSLEPDKRLSLKRSYKKVTGGSGDIHPGDIVQITLDFQPDSEAPEHWYRVTDHLPSGLVYLANPNEYGLGAFGWPSANGQIITSYLGHYPWWRNKDGIFQIVYFARAASAGSFVAEPAIVQSTVDLSLYQIVPAQTLQIK